MGGSDLGWDRLRIVFPVLIFFPIFFPFSPFISTYSPLFPILSYFSEFFVFCPFFSPFYPFFAHASSFHSPLPCCFANFTPSRGLKLVLKDIHFDYKTLLLSLCRFHHLPRRKMFESK